MNRRIFPLYAVVLMAVVVIPRSTAALWFTLGATALALAACLPSCAAMLSLAASDQEQGRAMGDNQSMRSRVRIAVTLRVF
jgi:uncharacterized membrane protein